MISKSEPGEPAFHGRGSNDTTNIAYCRLQIANCKAKSVMEKFRTKLSDRFLNFGIAVIRIARRLRTTPIDSHLAKQLLRSATSAGANYEEGCGAESMADFVHKLQICLKELNETRYWLRLIQQVSLRPENKEQLGQLIKENQELCSIIARSIITSKSKVRAP